MEPENNIDYDALKKRGFLRTRQKGYFALRTRMPAGNYRSIDLEKIAQVAEKYGRGIVHLTLRQGIEVPFVRFEDIDAAEKEIQAAGIQLGTSGPRLRPTTACPGSTWCKTGLIDTFLLFDRIENEKNIKCAMDLPHKFKIAISGCPNACTRVQVSEIGIHGAVNLKSPKKEIGYAVYIGGCGGKNPRIGFKLEKIFTDNEVLSLIARVVEFYKNNAKPRQRLGQLIEEIGQNAFLEEIGI